MHKLYCWSLNVDSPGLPMCLIGILHDQIHAHHMHAAFYNEVHYVIRMGVVMGVVYQLGRGMWVWLFWSLKPFPKS